MTLSAARQSGMNGWLALVVSEILALGRAMAFQDDDLLDFLAMVQAQDDEFLKYVASKTPKPQKRKQRHGRRR